MFSRVKGTQDFLDLTLFNFVIDRAKKHLGLYGFHEIATPLIEHTQLFTRSLGADTDVVHKQMFTIKTKDDEELCLRPEATASTVRAFVEASITTVPWNVFSWGPMFRYERPQKGRYRQFHQISLESIGAATIFHDVQLLVMLDRFFHEKLQMNTYALIINYLGCLEDRIRYKEYVRQQLIAETNLCEACMRRKETNMLRIFDCKETGCQEIYQAIEGTTNYLCTECEKEWQEMQQLLMMLSVSFSHKSKLVRGLDYYSKTVFEFESHNLGAQATFCAGGRYNQLVGEIGARPDVPAVGAAIGIERVMLLLEQAKENLRLPSLPTLYMIMPMDNRGAQLGLLIADQMREEGLVVEVMFDNASIKTMMKKANSRGAAYAIIIGQEEIVAHEVTVKNMMTGHQERVAQRDLVEYCKRKRA